MNIRDIRLILIVLAFSAISVRVNALDVLDQGNGQQENDTVKGKRVFAPSSGGLGFFLPGIHTVKFSELNGSMPEGIPEITNKPFVTTGAGYGIFYNVVVGGQGGTMHAGSFVKDDVQADLEGEFGFFSLGYVVWNKKGLVVFPTASIGDNTMKIYLHPKDQPNSFSNITSQHSQAVTLLYKRPMLKFALSGVYVLQGAKSDNGSAGLMLGFEAGYQMPYKKGIWTYDGGTVTGGPEFDPSGFFIQLMIGGGGVWRK